MLKDRTLTVTNKGKGGEIELSNGVRFRIVGQHDRVLVVNPGDSVYVDQGEPEKPQSLVVMERRDRARGLFVIEEGVTIRAIRY